MHGIDVTILLAGVVAGAAPILLATLGETITEKAGIINLSLDGTIILSAMTGFVTAMMTGSLLAGFIAAAVAGAASPPWWRSSPYAWASPRWRWGSCSP